MNDKIKKNGTIAGCLHSKGTICVHIGGEYNICNDGEILS
jgi:hypothetical protein